MKILITIGLLSCISSVVMAGGLNIAITTATKTKPNFAKCSEMDESSLSRLSRTSFKQQICLFENYSKLMNKWITNPPETTAPANSITLEFGKKETTEEVKGILTETSEKCLDVSLKMRVKFQEMYGEEEINCK